MRSPPLKNPVCVNVPGLCGLLECATTVVITHMRETHWTVISSVSNSRGRVRARDTLAVLSLRRIPVRVFPAVRPAGYTFRCRRPPHSHLRRHVRPGGIRPGAAVLRVRIGALLHARVQILLARVVILAYATTRSSMAMLESSSKVSRDRTTMVVRAANGTAVVSVSARLY